MSSVLQMTRCLTARPEPPALGGVRTRTFAGPEDVPLWLELRHRAFARQRLGVRHWDATDFQSEFLDKPWWRPEHLWFAEVQHAPTEWRPVGAVTLAFRGQGETARPVVHWLAVAPLWRRRGIGRLLMATLEACCWDAGYRQVWLETHADWQAAVEMYRQLGYVDAAS